ncbi:methionyl aminopeptidase [Deinococcus metalli]|uniref:Methionine aminopeptidase n=1 Tax=Deinococcus metalli TaxID=1141878 RepID=A0A7W8NP97_9DEIO|nr:type I methionyl aminopeptidase [Deinococcus metalli]MBB5376566.1 methionyl aminopeptidase [Deinococcus metalli]GHF43086.1 methionine aminopeptidase 2 [Deinococcus metalli]
MTVTTEADLKGMQRAGHVVAETLRTLRAAIRPGITPAELDALAGRVYRAHGARSAPRMTYNAPVNVFVSVNDDIVHGLPTRRPLAAGDVVSLDVTPFVDGFIADAAVTVAVPPASPVALRLIGCAEAAFHAGLSAATAGQPVHAIGRAVETEVRRRGFTVLRDLFGHGVGRAIHEAPNVPNYYRPVDRTALHEGLVIAVEPMVSTGKSPRVRTRRDGWTLSTTDGGLAAHFEHTVMITRGRPVILTA